MWKHLLILGIILAAFAGFLFWKEHTEDKLLQDTHRTATRKQVPTQQEGTTTGGTESTQERTEKLSKAETVKQGVHAVFSTEQLATPAAQKMLEIMDSPEFAAFMEREHYTSLEFYEFLASQGAPDVSKSIMKVHEDVFQEAFPTETPASVLPQMRQTLHDYMEEGDMDVFEVVIDFVSDPVYNAWGYVYFQTDLDAFANWTVDTLINYAPDAKTADVGEPPPPIFTTETERTDVRFDEERSTETSDPAVPNTIPPLPENSDLITEDFDVETEIRKLLDSVVTGHPDPIPAEDSFEKSLRTAFAPQRVNTALQILGRYGPEEGLRRLQKSDPDIAKHLERLVPKK